MSCVPFGLSAFIPQLEDQSTYPEAQFLTSVTETLQDGIQHPLPPVQPAAVPVSLRLMPPALTMTGSRVAEKKVMIALVEGILVEAL